MNAAAHLSLLAALAASPWAGTMAAAQTVDAVTYDRAARHHIAHSDRYVLNGEAAPHWRDGDHFTYRKALGDGRGEFVHVDAATGARTPAFDHALVAQGLGKALGRAIAPDRLPFADFDETGAATIGFTMEQKAWTCATAKAECSARDAATPDPAVVASPDGKWLAFVKDDNLWVRPASGGEAFALTHDGALDHGYAVTPGNDQTVTRQRITGAPLTPEILWSPDSRRIFTYRLDERQVRETVVTQAAVPGESRAKSWRWRYAFAGDPVLATVEPWLFDVAARKAIRVAIEPIATGFMAPVRAREVWWSADGARLYAIVRDRYFRTMRLHAIDPASGAARTLVSETGKTFVEPNLPGRRPITRALSNGEVIWFSERDGRGHLYLYDREGRLKRRLTEGDWSVRGIVHVDAAKRQVFLLASGREAGADPYYRRLYRLDLATGTMTLLTPEDGDHVVAGPEDEAQAPEAAWGFAPSGRWFLDSFSRPDLPPRTVLRRADGTLVAEIERADISALEKGGLTMPERFSAIAADGKTRLYGNILRPSNFDPKKRYPVIDSVYPGPQIFRAFTGFMDNIFDPLNAQSFAELGFIVVLIDGRGTPGRSKAFLDESYGRLSQAGHLDDHVAVLRQLGARYPQFDLDRVGVYGSSGGGFAALRAMLDYPDVYKAAVAAAGNHDQRGYVAIWGETYLGPDDGRNYAAADNAAFADRLRGRLLLLHGDMDLNVPVAQTLRVADALVRANKDFELMIVPNAGHGVMQGYGLRRSWDFMVRNLMGAEPPAGYALARPGASR